MPPIIVATCWPAANSPPGAAATTPVASMPEHAREGHAFGEAQPGVQLGAVEPERLHPDEHPAWARVGDRQLADPERLRRARGLQHDGAHGRRHVPSPWSIEVSRAGDLVAHLSRWPRARLANGARVPATAVGDAPRHRRRSRAPSIRRQAMRGLVLPRRALSSRNGAVRELRATPFPQLGLSRRVESGDIASGGSDAERERLPPFFEARMLNADRVSRLLDLAPVRQRRTAPRDRLRERLRGGTRRRGRGRARALHPRAC